ncbi:MAG: type I DNA topoisomerase [Planctomycetota bacterium]
MSKRLVIVESPTKAKTLRKFLGKDFVVESSVGHIRDLPANAADVPEKDKKKPWARLGVDVDNDFQPLYVVSPEKKKVLSELKKHLKDADELLLATDEDREGEAISWHLSEELGSKVPMKRMVFHEITREAVLEALRQTRPIDRAMVEAQEARRVIDRLYGYEVSPILWRKIAPRLSAGRVQSVAIRMIVERELERMRFIASEYWDLAALLLSPASDEFPARLVSASGKRVADGRDFDPATGKLTRTDVVLLNGERARAIAKALLSETFKVASIEEKPFTQNPLPPFTTSTLQQEGARKLRFEAKRTMRAAQRLYELGYITYMRTDSVALSEEALRSTRSCVTEMYGAEYLPAAPRVYKTKVKNAQEAHEAIRPAGESFPRPAELEGKVSIDERKLYELIWMRTMASQMNPAQGRRMVVRLSARANGEELVFQATGKTIDYHGFLRAYVEGSDDPDEALKDREVVLPPLREGDAVRAKEVNAEEHSTQPPARLTEASLVAALEESGIGRPSTYASIIDTIQRREYTFKKGNALVPTFTAFAVVNLMKDHFGTYVDYNFTADMEDRLDAISRGELERIPYLREFYFGNGKQGTGGLKPLLEKKTKDIDPRQVCSIPIGDDPSGEKIILRVGRYGPFLQRGDQTAPVPDSSCPDEITPARAMELLEKTAGGPQVVGTHPADGKPIYVKVGRFGPYVQLGEIEDEAEKPKMVSLLPGMTPETVTLDQAVSLLSLPRTVGVDPQGIEVIAHYGRFGAYIKRGADTRSLKPSDNVLTIGLARCLELLAEEKVGRGRQVAAPLRVYEKVEALDGIDLKVFEGRYGAYISDGDVNASLPRDMAPAELELGQAVQLILDRRVKVGSGGGKRGRKKASTRRTGAKPAKAAASDATAEAAESPVTAKKTRTKKADAVTPKKKKSSTRARA